jgi:mRNA degradation ribonuclease J1/J2
MTSKNGDVLLYHNHQIEKIEEIATDIIGVDRLQETPLSSQLVKNRRRLAYNCSVYIGMVLTENWQIEDLQISSIDILEEEAWNALAAEILEKVTPLAAKKCAETENRSQLEDFIRGQIRRRVYAATDIKPVTFLHVSYLEDITS